MNTHPSPSPSLFAVLKSILLLVFYPILAFRESRTRARTSSAALKLYGLGCIMTMVLVATALVALNVGHKSEHERLVNTLILLVIYIVGGFRTVSRIHNERAQREQLPPSVH